MELIFETSKKIIQNVKNENISFPNALKKILGKEYNQENKTKILSLCGIFLRNYYFIEFISKDIFNVSNFDAIILIGLGYSSISFEKFFNKNDVLEYLKLELEKKYKHKVNVSEENKFIEVCKIKKDYLASKLQNEPLLYFSIKFNVPIWLFRLFEKQYGIKNAVKICRELSKMPRQYVLKNPFMKIPQDFNKLLTVFKQTDNYYFYDSKTSVRKNPLVKNLYFYPLQLAELNILHELEDFERSNITYFLGYKNFLYFDVINKYLNKKNNINIAIKDYSVNFEILKKIKELKLPNVYVFESKESGLIARLHRKQDLIIYAPDCSDFDAIRKNLETVFLLNTLNLDDILKNIENGLEEIYQHLEVGGTLIYMVPTIDKKETNLMIKNFISKHDDLNLIKEHQFFPYDKEESVFYYALIRKNEDD